MNLTEQELLLLDNVMYYEGSVTGNYETLGDLVNDCLNNPSLLNEQTLSGGFDSVTEQENGIENFREILREISENDKLMKLKMRECSDMKTDNLVRARCFVQTDEMGNEIGHTVAFRGTGGTVVAWRDNFQGLYMEETDAQRIAREFIEGLDYNDLSVTGHSKGGNLAMYVTARCGDKVQNCVSFDGQGFGQNCLNSLSKEQLEIAGDKIKSVSAHNDFVNILLTSIAGTNMFVENEAGGANAHSPYHLYVSNEEMLDANGGMFNESLAMEQDGLMDIGHNSIDLLVDALPEDQEELVSDVIGAIAAHGLSKDADVWDTLGNIGTNMYEYNIEQGHWWKDRLQSLYNKTPVGKVDSAIDTVQYLKNNEAAIKDIGENVMDYIEDFSDMVKDKAEDFGDMVKDSVEDFSDMVKDKAEDFGEMVKDSVEDFSDMVKDKAEDFGELVKNTVSDIKESVKDSVQEIGESIGDFWEDMDLTNNATMSKKLILSNDVEGKIDLSTKKEKIGKDKLVLKRDEMGELSWGDSLQSGNAKADLEQLCKKDFAIAR